MPGRPRRRHTCWTCRVRRKRCDGASPVCRSCHTLNITCYTGIAKPEWMDGGARQSEMAQTFKAQIKLGATSRRDRQTGDVTDFVVISQNDYNARESDEPAPLPPVASEDLPPADAAVASPIPLFASLGKAWEMDFIMRYMDYVFPFLFPFYRPPVVATGRSWLLSFVRLNRAVLHSVLSSSAFFFTFAMRDIFPGTRKHCISVTWRQVEEQAAMSFDMLHADLATITRPDHNASLLERMRMMGTIVHLLVFDLFIGRTANWETHLAPAVSLFEEVIGEAFRASPDMPGLACALDQVKWPRPRFPGFERQLWDPDQACFRFFSAILMFIDIVASTSLQKIPRLKQYHSQIVGELPPEGIAMELDLFAFVGCHNWALLAVGDITALDEWKKGARLAGTLNREILAARAGRILERLQTGMEELDCMSSLPDHNIPRGSRHLQPYYQAGSHILAEESALAPTRLWAHAARIYLHVVVSGWDPTDAAIQRHTTQVVDIASAIDSAAEIRTLAWPICVAGCLARGTELQRRFRDIVNTRGDVQLRSAIREAGLIMEEVWRRGDGVDAETWDIASCLQVLGKPALLV